jgi:hypothetical protein
MTERRLHPDRRRSLRRQADKDRFEATVLGQRVLFTGTGHPLVWVLLGALLATLPWLAVYLKVPR